MAAVTNVPNGLTELSSDTKTDKYISYVVKVLLVAVPALLAVFHPHGSFTSQSAQALIVAVGLAAAALLHVGELVAKNVKEFGLTKAAAVKTLSETESWYAENGTDIKNTIEGAKSAIETVKGGADVLNQVQTDIKTVSDRLDAIPVVDQEAIKGIVTSQLASAFGGAAPATPAPAPAAPAA